MDMHRYAQMDFVMTQQKWRNSVKNVQPVASSAFDSDHKCNIVTFRTKLASPNKKSKDPVPRYRKPSDEQKNNYNDDIRNAILWHTETEGKELTCQDLSNIVKQAASNTLTKLPKGQKQPFISQETWNLMEKRDECTEKGLHGEAKDLNAQMKKKIAEEKRNTNWKS